MSDTPNISDWIGSSAPTITERVRLEADRVLELSQRIDRVYGIDSPTSKDIRSSVGFLSRLSHELETKE